MHYFKNKTILLISPQKWGVMHLSKHYYAIELAKRGNTVYFLNPADIHLKSGFEIVKNDKYHNLYIVTYKPKFPFTLRFHFKPVFDLLMHFQIKYLLKKLPEKICIIWCFNPFLYSDLRKFEAELTIFHPVDIYDNPRRNSALHADVIFSVTQDILQKFKTSNTPHFLIDHGLAEPFARCAQNDLQENNYHPGKSLKFGYIGNLLIPGLDRKILKKIISDNDKIQFHFWGPLQIEDSNVSGVNSKEVTGFIEFLNNQDNVVTYGVQTPEKIAAEIQYMDGFLICYDLEREMNKGANTHKILEYLSTGKVIVANHVSAYSKNRDLIEMMDDKNNDSFPGLFNKVINDIEYYNNDELRKKRIQFALGNTYANQIDRIEKSIQQLQNL